MHKHYDLTVLPAEQEAPADLLVFLRGLMPELGPEQWHWTFRGSPCGADVIVARHRGQILGHYATIGVPFQLHGRACTVAKGECSLVDKSRIRELPATSDRRVYRHLVDTALDRNKKAGIPLTFTMSNAAAHKTQAKAGIRHIDPQLRIAVCILSMSEIARAGRTWRARLGRLLAPIYDMSVGPYLGWVARDDTGIRPLGETDGPKLEQLANDIAEIFPWLITTRRTWPYIQWRFNDDPHRTCVPYGSFAEDGRLQGIVVVSVNSRSTHDFGEIVDLLAVDQETTTRLLRFAISWMRRKRVPYVEIWNAPRLPAYRFLNKCLRRLGFLFSHPRPLKIGIFSPGEEAAHDVRNRRRAAGADSQPLWPPSSPRSG
jgi:hypothetical protein